MIARTLATDIKCIVVVLVMALPAFPVAAQDPVFQLQPGLSTADFVSVAEGIESTTGFSLRFATRFPTSQSWLTPVIGAVLLPYGSTGTGSRNTDAPTLFVGNVFSIKSASPSGWFSIELPVLLTHSPGAGPTGNPRDFGRDLVVMPTLYLHLGARALGDLGSFWSRLDVFGQVEQNLTPNRDPEGGRRDRLNPVATVGASFTVGDRRRNR